MMKEVFGLVLLLVLSTAFGQGLPPTGSQPLPPGPAQPRPSPPPEELHAPTLIPAAPAPATPPQLAEPKSSLPQRPFAPKVDPLDVQRRLSRLKMDREGLKSERNLAVQALEDNEPSTEKIAQLRLRVGQLLGRLASHRVPDKGRAPPSTALPTTPVGPPLPLTQPSVAARSETVPRQGDNESTSPAIDALALARTLFRGRDFAGALKAFQQVNLSGLKPEERRPVEYLMATCHKHLGRLDEAAAIYREVAGSKGDEVLADCAQWQLSAIRWQRDLDQQLRQPQQRLQDLENQP